MLNQIQGLHHVTAMARGARANNAFFTRTLGLRRVKKTVNFDAPEVYHLYYGDAAGRPGTVMTYFPFPGIGPRMRGAGEVAVTSFAVPRGTLDFWERRLAGAGVRDLARRSYFGAERLTFSGPDGEELALVEAEDGREPWTAGGVPAEAAIRGFHGVRLRLRDGAPVDELLRFMGYDLAARETALARYRVAGGNGADIVDLEEQPDGSRAAQGAGSVHHVAFAARDREALLDAGHRVTPVIDRDYFWSIYFRTPGGVLFEVATNEPGFTRDEDLDHLGEELRLPKRHAHLRGHLETYLEPLE